MPNRVTGRRCATLADVEGACGVTAVVAKRSGMASCSDNTFACRACVLRFGGTRHSAAFQFTARVSVRGRGPVFYQPYSLGGLAYEREGSYGVCS